MLGGGEIALFNLSTGLKRDGVEPVVVLFEMGKLWDKLIASGVEVKLFEVKSSVKGAQKDDLGIKSILRFRDILSVISSIVRLSKLIREINPQIVHCNNLKSNLIGGFAGRLAGKKVIWHIRDRYENDYLPPAVVKLLRLLARYVPHGVVANSQSTLDTVRLPKNKAQWVIYSGIQLPIERPDKTFANPVRIGIVGRIAPWKGQHIFLESAALVVQKYPMVQFVVIGAALFGEHEYTNRVKDRSRQPDLAGKVVWEGFRDDVIDAIDTLDVVVHASVTAEPFGQVVVEGMAMKKPVIATAGGGVLEIIQDNTTGVLVPMNDSSAMADAICNVLADPLGSAEMGKKARQRVIERFTTETSVKKAIEVYKLLLGSSQ
jgi:glycosyltransferase involved in cell wall biosynthesis